MVAILVLSLVLSLSMAFVLVVAMFLSVAFSTDPGPKIGGCQFAPAAAGGWSVRGIRRPSPVESTAKPLRPRTVPSPPDQCHVESDLRFPILVTPPEALAIANYLRATQSPEDYTAIASRARQNAIDADRSPFCPLLGGEGVCAAFAVRPIWCQTCALCQARASEDFSESFDETVSHVNQEIEQGLSAGLRLAELDGTPYELNRALVVAMTVPDAAGLWGHGGDLFRSCHPC